MTKLQLVQECQIIPTGKFDKDFSITLHPIDSNFSLLSGNMYFPSELYPDVASIDALGRLWHTEDISLQIEEYLNSITPRVKNTIVIRDTIIPVIADSYFAVKGEAYYDRSLYALRLISQFTEDEYKSPSINIESLIFMQRLMVSQESPQKLLDEIISKAKQDFKEEYPKIYMTDC